MAGVVIIIAINANVTRRIVTPPIMLLSPIVLDRIPYVSADPQDAEWRDRACAKPERPCQPMHEADDSLCSPRSMSMTGVGHVRHDAGQTRRQRYPEAWPLPREANDPSFFDTRATVGANTRDARPYSRSASSLSRVNGVRM
jgi:hypothetical protein